MDIHNPSPWTPAMVATWEDGEVMVRWLVSGEYVASGSNRAEATAALRAFGVSPSSVDWAALDAPVEAPADAHPAYSFYVGSTAAFRAHEHPTPAGHPVLAAGASRMGYVDHVYGVWEGEIEETAVYQGVFSDDATAQRIAYAMAVATGNDCVMVTRDARPGEGDNAMSSVRRYLVSEERTTSGNRTLILPAEHWEPEYRMAVSGGLGYRFVPDVKGSEVAYLVHADASVSAVS